MRIDPSIKEALKKHLGELLKDEKETVTLVVPHSLNNEELSSLYESIPHLKDRHTQFSVDKNIIAGVVIKFGSKVIDLSLHGQLQKLKQNLYEID